MTEEPIPIAYTALQPGTPVLLSDGSPFATVDRLGRLFGRGKWKREE